MLYITLFSLLCLANLSVILAEAAATVLVHDTTDHLATTTTMGGPNAKTDVDSTLNRALRGSASKSEKRNQEAKEAKTRDDEDRHMRVSEGVAGDAPETALTDENAASALISDVSEEKLALILASEEKLEEKDTEIAESADMIPEDWKAQSLLELEDVKQMKIHFEHDSVKLKGLIEVENCLGTESFNGHYNPKCHLTNR